MVERVPGRFGPDTHPDDLLLSDYLVGAVDDPAVTRSIEEHLASCEVCRQVLGELGEVVRLLDQLPEPVPPRSFRLTPEMAGVGTGAPDQRLLRMVPAVRWAGLIAAVFLVALLVTDAVVHHSTSPGSVNQPVVALSTSASASSGTSASSVLSAPVASPAGEPAHANSAARSSESTPGGTAAAAIVHSAGTPASGTAAAPSSPVAEAFGATGSPASNASAKTAAASQASSPLAQASGGQSVTSAAQTTSAKAPPSTAWRWHIAELALALLVIWLLLLSVILPRLPRWRHTRN